MPFEQQETHLLVIKMTKNGRSLITIQCKHIYLRGTLGLLKSSNFSENPELWERKPSTVEMSLQLFESWSAVRAYKNKHPDGKLINEFYAKLVCFAIS